MMMLGGVNESNKSVVLLAVVLWCCGLSFCVAALSVVCCSVIMCLIQVGLRNNILHPPEQIIVHRHFLLFGISLLHQTSLSINNPPSYDSIRKGVHQPWQALVQTNYRLLFCIGGNLY